MEGAANRRAAGPEVCPRLASNSGLAIGGTHRRTMAVAIATVLAAGGVAYVVASGSLGGTLAQGLSSLGTADKRWLWLAAAGFAGSLFATAAAWRSTVNACGARMSHVDAWARYGVGSILNTFLPGRIGDAARVGLFSKAFPQDRGGRALTAVGALGAVSIAEALTQAPIVGAAAGFGAVPLWSILAVVGIASGLAGLAFAARKRLRGGRIRHLVDAFGSLSASPRQAAHLFAWSGAATASRVLAAAAIAAAVGIPSPLEAGLIMSAVLSLATAIPLTPGNVGVTSAAIVLALDSRGVPLASAIAAGVAFHAVEAAAGIIFGAGGALFLARYRSPAARLWSLRAAGALASLILVAGLGATTMPALA